VIRSLLTSYFCRPGWTTDVFYDGDSAEIDLWTDRVRFVQDHRIMMLLPTTNAHYPLRTMLRLKDSASSTQTPQTDELHRLVVAYFSGFFFTFCGHLSQPRRHLINHPSLGIIEHPNAVAPPFPSNVPTPVYLSKFKPVFGITWNIAIVSFAPQQRRWKKSSSRFIWNLSTTVVPQKYSRQALGCNSIVD
jgi:hypothetical protein